MTANAQAVNVTLKQRYLAHAHRVFIIFFALAWLVLVSWGWAIKDQDYISASSGLGYFLGLAGGCMLLLLLTYSLRKRFKPLRNLFHLKYWFRLHMALGVLAPTAILFHSEFSFGSPNSTVALICLLSVAGSGLIGRFLYSRIHAGVHGEKIKLVQVRKDFSTLQDSLNSLAVTPKQHARVEKIFTALEALILAQRKGSFRSLWKSRRRAQVISRALTSTVEDIERYHRKHPQENVDFAKTREEIHNCLDVMQVILKKLPGLYLFERLFSLWHVVHLPIFGLMLVTVVTHVIVVHMY